MQLVSACREAEAPSGRHRSHDSIHWSFEEETHTHTPRETLIPTGMTLDSLVGFCRSGTNQGSQLLYCKRSTLHCWACPQACPSPHQNVYVLP